MTTYGNGSMAKKFCIVCWQAPLSIGTTSARPNKTADLLSLDLFSFFGQVLDCSSKILLPACELHLPGQRNGDDAQQLGVQQR